MLAVYVFFSVGAIASALRQIHSVGQADLKFSSHLFQFIHSVLSVQACAAMLGSFPFCSA